MARDYKDDEMVPDPNDPDPTNQPKLPMSSYAAKVKPAKKLQGVRESAITTLKVNDWVRFTSSDLGPEGLLKVTHILGDETTLLHEDGSTWSAELGAVSYVRAGGRPKFNLKVDTSGDDVTAATLEELGFQRAPVEDFTGAGEHTYFKESVNGKGFTTVVYDLQPPRGRGQPAIHAYYTTEDGSMAAGLACFTAKASVGNLQEILELAKKAAPTTSSEQRGLRSLVEFVTQLKAWC